jgi:Tfp pilus assembly protein PilF
MRNAEKEIALQNYAEAEHLLIQALTISPEAIDTQAELAKLYLTTGREAKAEALYKELTGKRDDVSFFANLGLAYYKQAKYVDACFAYQEALNRDPQTPERSAALGRACIAARRFQDAAPLLEKALMRMARDTELLHLLAECYVQLGDNTKAEETYRRINKLEPYDEGVKQKISALAAKQ